MLEKVQRKAVGMVSGLQARSYEQRLVELNFPSLGSRRWRGDMISVRVHHILTGVDRVDPSRWFDQAGSLSRSGATRTRHMGGTRTLVPRTGRTDKTSTSTI